MSINQALRSYARQPLTHQLLMSLLKDYKRPNDKVHTLLNEGLLESIKKGLYIAGPALDAQRPEPFLLANHIFGPSYISSDSALSYYGLIPERVYEVSSMTTKPSRKYKTSMGMFTYTKIPLPYYSFGITQEGLSDREFVMMATPEKALFDKVVTTRGLILRSQKSVISYLIDDLRIDEDSLKSLDIDYMSAWLPDSPKKDTLSMIVKTIKSL